MINKVILLGRLGKDPVVKQLDNGRLVCNIPLATNDYYTDKEGNRKENTEWHNLEIWDNQARTAEKYLHKGSIVYIEGKIRTDKYTDQDGQERQLKKIRVLNLQMMSGLGRREGDGDSQQKNYTSGSNQPVFEKFQDNDSDNNQQDDVDDDLPF